MTLAGSTLEVSPPIDATGQTYTIDYTVTDSAGAAASAKVTVTVTEPKRPPPTAVPDVARTTQGEPIFVTVLANDVDPVGQGLTLIAANVTDGSGTASVSVDQVVYQPDPGYFGEATFTYTIEDARRTEAGRAVGTVSVTVIGRPGAPSTPQATADNATATVTWALPPIERLAAHRRRTAGERRTRDVGRGHERALVVRSRQRAAVHLPGARRQRSRLGRVERVLGAGHPRHHARAAVVSDGRVRRRAAHA